jgi:hypothetical protein
MAMKYDVVGKARRDYAILTTCRTTSASFRKPPNMR